MWDIKEVILCDGLLEAYRDDLGWRVYRQGSGISDDAEGLPYVGGDGKEVRSWVSNAPRFGTLEEAKDVAAKWMLLQECS